MSQPTCLDSFRLTNRVAVITGGGGMLGRQHAMAVAEVGGTPILLDLDEERARHVADEINEHFDVSAAGFGCDIVDEDAVSQVHARIQERYSYVNILINNAANNPKVENGESGLERLETISLSRWNKDLGVSLTGAFLCSREFGQGMAKRNKGVILNVASDLALIAPDQRLYHKQGVADEDQPVKPVTYSVAKAGLIGLTRYLATYWAHHNVRCNAICPGGIYHQQDARFVESLSERIPLGRMAKQDEYKASVVYLVSDASSYMTGSVVSVDGGRTAW